MAGVAFFAQDDDSRDGGGRPRREPAVEKTRIGSEAEFDLDAVDVGHQDLNRSSGEQFPKDYGKTIA